MRSLIFLLAGAFGLVALFNGFWLLLDDPRTHVAAAIGLVVISIAVLMPRKAGNK